MHGVTAVKTKSTMITVRMTPEEKAHAEMVARELGVPLSWVVRMLLQYIARDEATLKATLARVGEDAREIAQTIGNMLPFDVLGALIHELRTFRSEWLKDVKEHRSIKAAPPLAGGGSDGSARPLFTTEEGGET